LDGAYISTIVGPVVIAENAVGFKMHEMVSVGDEGLVGEVIRLRRSKAYIQVYEDTTGLKPMEPVKPSGKPLVVELGPGLLGQIFDGIQRPLTVLKELAGAFVRKGLKVNALNRGRKWPFRPVVSEGVAVEAGDVIGEVAETASVKTRIMVPPGVSGIVDWIASEGRYSVEDVVAVLRSGERRVELNMIQEWPVRKPRPFKTKLPANEPMVTGLRTIDMLFPLAKGGVAAVIGGFGTGKTVIQQHMAKWAEAQIVVYVGCGERGNEMTEILETFPKLTDPRTGHSMMEHTILIANTSNMPVAAREASIYTGITIAEYFRDMGYDVSLMADSTSRWAEALREISARLGEVPGEEGYPTYLADMLAEFYERAGRVRCLGSDERHGSITIIGAVSPPSDDISEPVTQSTLRIVKTFFSLDRSLAEERHFPAISWVTSYSLYYDFLEKWFVENVSPEWPRIRSTFQRLLQQEAELKEIARLVGPDALPERDRFILYAARMVRECFLMQDLFHPVDQNSDLEKTFLIAKAVDYFYRRMFDALMKGGDLEKIFSPRLRQMMARLKFLSTEELKEAVNRFIGEVDKLYRELTG